MRVFAGMEFKTDGIEFEPFVPKYLTGDKQIKNFKYRDADLDIVVKGTGDEITQFAIDGNVCDEHFFPATMSGKHTIEIIMADNDFEKQPRNATQQAWMPSTPIVDWVSQDLAVVKNYKQGLTYDVYHNGVYQEAVATNEVALKTMDCFTMIDIVPVDADKLGGFTMQPLEYVPDGAMTIIQAEKVAVPGTKYIADGKKARRFVETTITKNTKLMFNVTVAEGGTYFVDVRYANGSGPINTENKCAIRTLVANGERAGALVMPQRGIGEWLSTGFSNRIAVNLNAGENKLSIEYLTPENINMNGDVNTALIDYIRIIRK